MWIVPPWRSTIVFATLSPNPVPLPAGLVVKNGSKMRPTWSGGMPAPSSRTVTVTVSPLAALWIQILPRSPIASHALARMFMNT